ncbi:MAG: dihydropteroate synthase [Vicinamibacterales bacterium]
MSVQRPFPVRRPYRIGLPGGRRLELGLRTLVMGVLNVTPDSFSDGGRFATTDAAVAGALALVEAGADIIDIGGESTRPGALPVGSDEECARVVPVIEALVRRSPAIVSVDTYKAAVAREAIEAGAAMVNDVSGLTAEPDLAGVVADRAAAIVLMHTRGNSADMYRFAQYADVVAEVADELSSAVERAVASGVPRSAVILDPGLGFAKRAPDSLALLARLDTQPLNQLDCPLLVGPSRKSFLSSALGERPPADRDWGTAAAVTAAILAGAHIVRVHNVAGMRDVARVADAVLAARAGSVG